jgi:hypothetical protein
MRAVKRNIQQLRPVAAVRALCGAAVFCLAAALLTSCILHEDVLSREATADGEPLVSIELRLPGNPYSYAITDPDENLIKTLDVLVFREGGDGKEYFLKHVVVEPSTIRDGGDQSGRTKTCTVEVPASGNYKQRLVFIANAHGVISAATAAGSLLKESLLSRIVFNMEEGNWPAESSVTFVPFPMWGESSLLELTEELTILSEQIYMMRMVARVDIRVDGALQNAFKLHGVYLYNRYTQGRVVPDSDVLEVTETTLTVNAPTVPAGVLPVTEPIANNFYTTDKGNLWSITQSIYLMENAATNRPLEATCFVVEGEWDGNVRYWRVALPRETGESDFSNGYRVFLRNYRYEVIITAVNGEGHDSPDGAFRDSWVELSSTVTQWNLADVVFSDREMFSLKASPSAFNYLRVGTDGVPGSFSISTDYRKSNADQGWTGEWQFSGADHSWLRFQGNPVFNGNRNEEKTYTFTVDENRTGEDRHAILKVTAGNLAKYVDIYQTNQVFAVGNRDVYDWTESGQSASPVDSPYRLGVSSTHVSIDGTAATTGSFHITTDYSRGYTTRATIITGEADWMTIQSGGSAEGPVVGEPLTFAVSDNLSIEPREAIIDVMAGNLLKRVRVVQNEYMYGNVPLANMDWVESGQSGVTTGGPYRLGVGRTRYEFPKNKQSGVTLAVATNDPKGYSAEVTKGNEWIEIKDTPTATWPNAASLLFDVAENDGTEPRVGEMCITADKLKKYITVWQDIVADVNSGNEVTDWEEDEDGWEEPVNGPYKLILSRQDIVCPGDGITVPMSVTATASASGVLWTAATTDNWITGLTSSGAADGTAQPLSFTVTVNNTGEPRSGIITVSVIHRGNKLTQDIHVRQYPTSDPVIRAEVDEVYVTDQLVRQSFTLYSKMNWAVRLKDGGDPSGILRTLYTTGGAANETGDNIWFALKTFSSATPPSENPPHTVTLEIYSPKGEFNTMEVEIHGVIPIADLPNIQIYPEDQPVNYSWYVYANVADNTNNTTEQGPGTEDQENPPRAGSCAALPANGGNPWRLPTRDEMKVIAAAVGSNASYNFTNSAFYWSATSSVHDGAYIVSLTDPGGDISANKTETNNRKARCVRDK